MNFKRIYAIFLRQLFLLRHNPTRFSNIFIWAVLDIILWGFITKYLDQVGNTGFSFVSTLLGAVLLWDFLIRVQQGVMLAFFEDVWARNFLNLFASPLRVREYVGGLVLTSITTSTAGLIVMLVLAKVFFGYSLFAAGFYFLPLLLTLFLFGLALGIFAVAIVLRLGPAAEWFSWPIPFIIGPFAGVFYPIATLPIFFQYISKLVPPSYAFEGMRAILLGEAVSAPDVVLGLVLACGYVVLAYFFFVYIYRIVLRTGLIARFSSESTDN